MAGEFKIHISAAGDVARESRRSGADYRYGLKVPCIRVGEDGRTTAEYPLQRGSLRLAWETGKTIPPLVTDKQTASGDVVTIEGNQSHLAEIDIQGTVVDAKVPTIGHADVRDGTLNAQEITTGNVSGTGPESMSHISVNKVNGKLTIGDYVDAQIGAVSNEDSLNITGVHTNVTVGDRRMVNGSSSAGVFESSEERTIGLHQELLSEILHLPDGREFMRYTTGDGGTIDIFCQNLVKTWPEVTYEETQKGSRVKIAGTLPLEAVVTTGFTDILADVPYIKELDVLGGDIEAQSVGTLILTGTATIHGQLGDAAVFGVSSLGAREVVGSVRVQGPLSEADKPLTYPEWEEQQRRNSLTEMWQRGDTDAATVVIQELGAQAEVSLSGRTNAMVGDAQEGQIVVIGNEATLNGRRVTQGTPRVRSFQGEGFSTLVQDMAGIIQNSPEFIASHYPRLQPTEAIIISEKEPYVIRRYECVDEAGQLHSMYLTEGLLERPAEVFGVNGTFMLTGKDTLLGVSVDSVGTKVNATAIDTVYRTHVAGEGSTVLLNELKSHGFVGKGAMLSAESAATATLSVRGEAQIEGNLYYLLSDPRSRVAILGDVTQSVALSEKYEEPILAERSKVAQGLALSSRLLALTPDEYKVFIDELRSTLQRSGMQDVREVAAILGLHTQDEPVGDALEKAAEKLTLSLPNRWKLEDLPRITNIPRLTATDMPDDALRAEYPLELARQIIALGERATNAMVDAHRLGAVDESVVLRPGGTPVFMSPQARIAYLYPKSTSGFGKQRSDASVVTETQQQIAGTRGVVGSDRLVDLGAVYVVPGRGTLEELDEAGISYAPKTIVSPVEPEAVDAPPADPWLGAGGDLSTEVEDRERGKAKNVMVANGLHMRETVVGRAEVQGAGSRLVANTISDYLFIGGQEAGDATALVGRFEGTVIKLYGNTRVRIIGSLPEGVLVTSVGGGNFLNTQELPSRIYIVRDGQLQPYSSTPDDGTLSENRSNGFTGSVIASAAPGQAPQIADASTPVSPQVEERPRRRGLRSFDELHREHGTDLDRLNSSLMSF